MTKQEAIERAYGEYWDKVKNNLTGMFWFKSREVLGDFANTAISKIYPNIEWECLDNYHAFFCYYFRPKSLKGLEDNKGWIKIESEDDLPKESCRMWVLGVGSTAPNIIYFTPSQFKIIHNTCSHYQTIIKPEPPIY
jgi:hypothetical protein